MRERLAVFAADVNRCGPLAVVSLATFVCLPSLLEFFGGRLAVGSMLGRYCVRFAARDRGREGGLADRADVRGQEPDR